MDARATERLGRRDGEIVLRAGGGNYIRTEKLYGNFTLALRYRDREGRQLGHRHPHAALRLALGRRHGDCRSRTARLASRSTSTQTMAIYGNVPPLARADKTEQWNHVVIKADGCMISAWVNGELVQQFNTADHPELKYAI